MDLTYDKVDQTVLPISNTRVVASEYNQIAGSLMSIISASGLTPDSADNTQLLNALKAIGSGWSLPSNVDITVTPGASGAAYTAPANGYFVAVCGGSIRMQVGNLAVMSAGTTLGGGVCFIPIQKDYQCAISYSTSDFLTIRFVYAKGSKSEAN